MGTAATGKPAVTAIRSLLLSTAVNKNKDTPLLTFDQHLISAYRSELVLEALGRDGAVSKSRESSVVTHRHIERPNW